MATTWMIFWALVVAAEVGIGAAYVWVRRAGIGGDDSGEILGFMRSVRSWGKPD